MTEHIRWEDKSRHTPKGPLNEAPAPRNMWEVIRGGAAATRLEVTRGCPSCGADPAPPAKILGRYVMECENESCVATFHVAGDSPADAVARWNRRAP